MTEDGGLCQSDAVSKSFKQKKFKRSKNNLEIASTRVYVEPFVVAVYIYYISYWANLLIRTVKFDTSFHELKLPYVPVEGIGKVLTIIKKRMQK